MRIASREVWAYNRVMMKRYLFALLSLVACAAVAQTVEFELKPSHSTYVVGEPIDFTLRLANVGPTPVIVDDVGPYADNRVWLEITTQNGNPVKPLGKTDIVESLMLMSGESFTDTFDTAEWYPILPRGRYYIRAILFHGGRRYETALRLIDIVPGLELASASEPIPGRPGHQRDLRLVYLAREQREFVFLRSIDDGGPQTSPTLRLGTIVRIARPTISIAPDGSITVRHQATRNRFQETRILSESDGLRVESENHDVDSKITPLINALTAPDETAAKPAEKPAPRPTRRPPAHPTDGW